MTYQVEAQISVTVQADSEEDIQEVVEMSLCDATLIAINNYTEVSS